MKKPIFQANPDAAILENLLDTRCNGGLVSYQEMSAAICRNVRGEGAHILQAARKRLERQGKIFAAVSGEGLRFVVDSEKADLLSDAAHKINRAAKRWIRRGSVDDITKLEPAVRLKFTLGMSRLALVEMSTSRRGEKKLEQLVANGQKPTSEMLEAMKQ